MLFYLRFQQNFKYLLDFSIIATLSEAETKSQKLPFISRLYIQLSDLYITEMAASLLSDEEISAANMDVSAAVQMQSDAAANNEIGDRLMMDESITFSEFNDVKLHFIRRQLKMCSCGGGVMHFDMDNKKIAQFLKKHLGEEHLVNGGLLGKAFMQKDNQFCNTGPNVVVRILLKHLP